MKVKQKAISFVLCTAVLAAIIGIGQNLSTTATIEAQETVTGSPIFLPSLIRSKGSFLATFDGDPAQPTPWNPTNWDITVHSRDVDTWDAIETMQGAHGPNCEPPPAAHTVSAYEDTVFQCKNHMMTAINAGGYGLIYLTPNQMVDFADGEAVISFDVSTLRTSGRDWIDVWVTPFDDNLQLALQDYLPDLSGEPRNAIHIAMDFSSSRFQGFLIRDFSLSSIPGTGDSWQGYESFLTPDARRRDTFELRISRNHIKFGMPAYNFWWIDTSITPLNWSQGVVQLGHHSYNPTKACTGCGPNTWHWDNVMIDPAVPFTMVRADRRVVSSATPAVVNFATAVPSGSYLRFTGIGTNLQVSFNNGVSWQAARVQPARNSPQEGTFKSYWMSAPAGTTSVRFKANDWWGGAWQVRDISIWSRTVRP